MADSVLRLLKKAIREQMNELADYLAVGNAKDMEDYRKITGMIEGLAWTEREIIDMEDRYKDF
jgi:hypothetical protein|tara:strand:- start:2757 stop:2945 length:189 start_codon:yes stop_codon:yes gene_type:complete